jgi:Protein of unknown function (DUF2950)
LNTANDLFFEWNDCIFGLTRLPKDFSVILAFDPAEYGISGIMTFIVNHEGVVYQKDLGNETGKIASAMTKFDPDKTWKKVEEKGK